MGYYGMTKKRLYDSTRMKNDLENCQKHSVAFDTYFMGTGRNVSREVLPYLLPFIGLLKETLTQPQFKDISIS